MNFFQILFFTFWQKQIFENHSNHSLCQKQAFQCMKYEKADPTTTRRNYYSNIKYSAGYLSEAALGKKPRCHDEPNDMSCLLLEVIAEMGSYRLEIAHLNNLTKKIIHKKLNLFLLQPRLMDNFISKTITTILQRLTNSIYSHFFP